jgi:hypothetical protein
MKAHFSFLQRIFQNARELTNCTEVTTALLELATGDWRLATGSWYVGFRMAFQNV